MTIKEKKAFVENFVEILRGEGDMFWSVGSTTKDFDAITSVIKAQGYWAGTSVRYFFNDKLEFEGVQERMFGA